MQLCYGAFITCAGVLTNCCASSRMHCSAASLCRTAWPSRCLPGRSLGGCSRADTTPRAQSASWSTTKHGVHFAYTLLAVTQAVLAPGNMCAVGLASRLCSVHALQECCWCVAVRAVCGFTVGCFATLKHSPMLLIRACLTGCGGSPQHGPPVGGGPLQVCKAVWLGLQGLQRALGLGMLLKFCKTKQTPPIGALSP